MKHIAMAVYGSEWKSGLLVMLTAYFDESGHPDSGPGLVVAGFVSTVQRWQKFESEWRKELEAFGVSSLHMKHYTSSQGEYAGWKGNEKKRAAFLARLIRVIKRRTISSIGSAMLLNDYREVDKTYELSEFISPYPLCAANCQHKTKVWSQEHGYPIDRIRFIYEDGAKHKGQFVELCEKLGFSSPIFEPKGNIVALEAADLIAYELRKIILDVEGNIFRLRASMAEVRKDMPRMWGIYTKDDILTFCKNQKLPLRGVEICRKRKS
jgi:Protein of unknown function (DUF3800)